MDICGQCNKEFENRAKYLEHECKVYGAKPTDPKAMGERQAVISEAAQERGAERKKLEGSGKSKDQAIKATRDIGKVVR